MVIRRDRFAVGQKNRPESLKVVNKQCNRSNMVKYYKFDSDADTGGLYLDPDATSETESGSGS